MTTVSCPIYNTSGEGFIKSGSDSSWAAMRSGANLTVDTSATTLQLQDTKFAGDGYSWTLRRVYLPFDTSAVPASGITITGANLNLYGQASDDSAMFNTSKWAIVASTQASVASLATSDWSAVGSTEFCSRQNLNITAGAWTTVALNASGLAAIVAGGTTKLALRLGYDLDNADSIPNFNQVYAQWWSQDYTTDTSKRPYLDVTYTVPGGGAPGQSFRDNQAAIRAAIL